MTSVVGIDVAKHSLDIATLQANGKHRTKSKLANTPEGFKDVEKWLEKHAEPGAWVVLEATGIYHEAVAEHLHEQGYRVCVMNPARIASYAQSELQRGKTDRTDAKLLATYGQRHVDQLRVWAPTPPAQRRLQALVRRLQDLKEIEQMERNRLDVSDASVQPSIHELLAHVGQQIAETLRAIKQHIDDDPDLRGRRDLLVSIDGIADQTAALLLAELGDPLQFEGARAIVAYAGLNPRLQQSGQYQGHVRISKIGSPRLRAGLFMPALVAMTHNPAIKALSKRLKEKGKAGKQIVCAAMRKLLHIAYGVLKSGVPFDRQRALAH
ncbi:Transposase IS116/IS110/IS902 family protein [compost metagenome]